MTAYTSFETDIAPYIRDIPRVLLQQMIKDVVRDFCKRTTIIRETHADITIVAGTANYTLSPTAGYTVAQIVHAAIGWHALKPKSPEELEQLYGGKWRSWTGFASFYYQEGHTEIRLAPVPQSATNDALVVRYAITPTRTATEVWDIVYNDWFEAILYGVRARAHDIPNQPFSDETAAKRFQGWYETAIGQAKIEANRGLTRAPLVVRAPMYY